MSRRALIALGLLLAAAVQPARAEATYLQPLQFEWTGTRLDVLVLPVAHGQVYNVNGPLGGEDPARETDPYDNSYMRAVMHSIGDVHRAIDLYGSEWLRERLVVNLYVVGRDEIPQAALADPDIVVTTDENKTVAFGLAAAVGAPICVVLNSKFFVAS